MTCCRCEGPATLGPPQDLGGCINEDIVCPTCGKTGVRSTRKDLA